MSLKPHQVRVVEEREALDDKIDKLSEFTKTGVYFNLPLAEKDRLTRQHIAMEAYSDILGERIAAFI